MCFVTSGFGGFTISSLPFLVLSPLKIPTSSNPVSIAPDTRTWVFLFFSFLDLNGAMSNHSEGILSPMCGDAQHDYRERWDVAPCKGRNDFYRAQGKLENVVLQQETTIPKSVRIQKMQGRVIAADFC